MPIANPADDKETRERQKRLLRPVEVASKVTPNPEHPTWSADRTVASLVAGGKSAIIAAIDGVGSGGEKSSLAAEAVATNLRNIQSKLLNAPNVKNGIELLSEAIIKSASEVEALKQAHQQNQLDSTVCCGLVCVTSGAKNPERILIIANVGDSRIYRYKYHPTSPVIEQVTTDHTMVDRLVKTGQLTPDEAFRDPSKNIIYRAVGDVKTKEQIDFTFIKVKPGEIYLATTDSLPDNIEPQLLETALTGAYLSNYSPTTNHVPLDKFVQGLMERIPIARTLGLDYAKPDDTAIVALRLPKLNTN